MHLGHYQLFAAALLTPSAIDNGGVALGAYIALVVCAAAAFIVDAIKTKPE